MPNLLTAEERRAALSAFAQTRSGREKPGRYWKIDLETLAPDASADGAAGSVTIENASPRAIAVDLKTAARDHAALLASAAAGNSNKAANTVFMIVSPNVVRRGGVYARGPGRPTAALQAEVLRRGNSGAALRCGA